MGWTHDDRDLARDRGTRRDRVPAQRTAGNHQPQAEPGIPRLLRRRARWFGARIRHTRG
ncbi:hypothetical protein [Streptomyces sp. ODS28]|uniref:hypothetical protein n=1 Tax=Streptomyces sp. ODS28 TaxID=3136688 RepID=UPI0031E994A2